MSQWNQKMSRRRGENKEAHLGMMRMMNQTLILNLAAVTAKKRNETRCKISMMIFKMEKLRWHIVLRVLHRVAS